MPADGKALFSIGRPYPWEVDDCPLDVSDLGCRQMAGNGKEWTSSLFITGMDLQLRGRSFTMLKPLAFADFTNLNFGSQDPAKPSPTTSFRVAIKIPWKKEPAP